jgi:hypothetical protein
VPKSTSLLSVPEDTREGEWKAPLEGASPSIRIETSLPSAGGKIRKGLRGAAKMTKTIGMK